jgi:hypothetical protein
MRPRRGGALAAALLSTFLVSAGVEEFAPECLPLPEEAPVTVVVGEVACQRLRSEHMGGVSAFSYYVPPACAPAHPKRGGNAQPHPHDPACPVLYLLHGTGGDHRAGYLLGSPGQDDAAYVRALAAGPPVDPADVADPWNHADPEGWVPKPPLDLILVAPNGATVPDGYGPAPNVDTGWTDWNPKYAAGGEYPRYDTPPPQSESWFIEEVLPFVDAHFPALSDRFGRALTGTSQGGFGSWKIGLKYPHLFASIAMVSGGGFPLVTGDWLDVGAPAAVAPPVGLPYVDPPGPVAMVAPAAAMDQTLVAETTVGFGDPVVDHVWWRAASPYEFFGNATARGADGRQALQLFYVVNDAVPRRTEDPLSSNYPGAQGFESAVLPLNLYAERMLDVYGIERQFALHPGLHSLPYWAPHYRAQLEAQYASLQHADGGGAPPPHPEVFDYRTPEREFVVWGWRVTVERAPDEFLNLTDVSCGGLTLRGSGRVTVTVPDACGTGVDGRAASWSTSGPTRARTSPSASEASTPTAGR